MGFKVATTTCFHWSQPFVPHSPSSSQTLASAISSPSSKRRGATTTEGAIVCRYVHKVGRRSTLFGTQPSSTKLYRTRSCEHPKFRSQTLRRACSASLDAFSEEEFSKKIQELALKFQSFEEEDEGNNEKNTNGAIVEAGTEFTARFDDDAHRESNTAQNTFRSTKLEPIEPPDWPMGDEIIPGSIERKANSVELPLSLRIIRRKKQWEEGFREAGESAYCSVKKAFSSMVFIIRELYSYTIQMREMLFYEDLQDVMVRVQREIHASFAWLFERVFSCTPTLMVYVMILLANYSVYSMANNTALAFTATSPLTVSVTTESVSVLEDQSATKPKFDSSVIKNFTVSSSSNGKTASIGGNNGGGGKYRPFACGTDGDGRSDGSVSSDHNRTILSDGTTASVSQEESVSNQVGREEELRLWNSVVEEASRMQALDHETKQRFVSPVDAKIEEDGYEDYFRKELLYQTALAQEPDNPLLLANYAQFLYLVTHDYDRAEDYFKKAVEVEPKDAEALSKYASFLWQVRKDLWAAEETYLEAISAEPSNSYYAANYAHFLWNTGGEDTCFPLSSPDSNTEEL